MSRGRALGSDSVVVEGKIVLDSVERDVGANGIEGPNDHRVQDEDYDLKRDWSQFSTKRVRARRIPLEGRHDRNQPRSKIVREKKRK